jgi:hypothetical protein
MKRFHWSDVQNEKPIKTALGGSIDETNKRINRLRKNKGSTLAKSLLVW